jgi:predicted RecB family nuclease
MDVGKRGQGPGLPFSSGEQKLRSVDSHISSRPEPRLSKSRYLSGLQCDKRLWLGWHQPETKFSKAGSILAIGTEVGEAARRLFPDGVLVAEGPKEFGLALVRTRELVGNPSVSTIFEAAFEYDRVLVRADIIRRLPGGGWGLMEVKSSTSAKPEHVDDLAVQTYVMRGAGIDVRSVCLVHVNREYERQGDMIDWSAYFNMVELTDQVEAALASLPDRVRHMHSVLGRATAPHVEPSRHCFSPFECEFWTRCTESKPRDWVFYLRDLRAETADELAALGIERMSLIPSDFALTARQRAFADCARLGQECLMESLADALSGLGPPCSYLDFETGAPALPLYPQTRPYQRIPFQWSLHRDLGASELTHIEFLADGRRDPRREFAETLISATAGDEPILVYSSYEDSVIAELCKSFPDLAPALGALQSRLRDLLPIVRRTIIHPEFKGSYSIKAVAPVLAPEVRYDDLEEVADGAAASAAFYRLATSQAGSNEDAALLMESLREYCRRDTLALAMVHRALRSRAGASDASSLI